MTSSWELGDVIEKVSIDFGKLFQRIGAIWLKARLDILREYVEGRMRDDGGELSDLWCQRQHKGKKSRGRRLVGDLKINYILPLSAVFLLLFRIN